MHVTKLILVLSVFFFNSLGLASDDGSSWKLDGYASDSEKDDKEKLDNESEGKEGEQESSNQAPSFGSPLFKVHNRCSLGSNTVEFTSPIGKKDTGTVRKRPRVEKSLTSLSPIKKKVCVHDRVRKCLLDDLDNSGLEEETVIDDDHTMTLELLSHGLLHGRTYAGPQEGTVEFRSNVCISSGSAYKFKVLIITVGRTPKEGSEKYDRKENPNLVFHACFHERSARMSAKSISVRISTARGFPEIVEIEDPDYDKQYEEIELSSFFMSDACNDLKLEFKKDLDDDSDGGGGGCGLAFPGLMNSGISVSSLFSY